MGFCITVLPHKQKIPAEAGANLLDVLRRAHLAPDAPCGGGGTCGKCKVMADGREVLACQTVVSGDMTVEIPTAGAQVILTQGILAAPAEDCRGSGYGLAFDIGTTTVAGYLVDGKTGEELASGSDKNPQTAFGADVITRIQHGCHGQMEALTAGIRTCVEKLGLALCERAKIATQEIEIISMVGNPAMQQLFLGICPENLTRIPFAPVLTKPEQAPAKAYLPEFEKAQLLIVPDISGFVGADTVAGVLATGMHRQEELTLLVDIGTNGEMVMGNRHRMVACSTAAGPALEGANIHFGMRAQAGAIDHVWVEKDKLQCSVLGNGEATGICGSGLMDAVAAALDLGWINQRGRIQNDQRCITITDKIYLTQEDIRQVQLAKGAIAAGIQLMADHLGISLQDITRVNLAGAFGTYLDPAAACRIGLLPVELSEKIRAVGNAAGSGAKHLALSMQAFAQTQTLVDQIEFLELANVPLFQRCFAQQMRFLPPQQYWLQQALALGFSHGQSLDVSTLHPRQEVRDMCAADKCRAYGKNWTCPPYCGDLHQCEEKIRQYSRGILLQTVGRTEKTIDTKAYRRTEQRHMAQFHRLAEKIRRVYPQALCLGSGGCRICQACAWPEPCRFPEKACSSMEGYGLFVTQVCRDNGCDYYHGEKTVNYTSCVLF